MEDYEKDAVKDIAFFGSNEVVEVLVKYQPYPGLYMWHCHNAVHEDNGMMALMNITRLNDLGYSELDVRLEDPMDPRFRPQKFKSTDLEDVKKNLLPAFARLRAYPDPVKVRDVEDQYWATRPYPDSSKSGEQVPKNTDPAKQQMHNDMHGTSSASSSAPKATASSADMSSHHSSSSGSMSGSMSDTKSDKDMSSVHGSVASSSSTDMSSMHGATATQPEKNTDKMHTDTTKTEADMSSMHGSSSSSAADMSGMQMGSSSGSSSNSDMSSMHGGSSSSGMSGHHGGSVSMNMNMKTRRSPQTNAGTADMNAMHGSMTNDDMSKMHGSGSPNMDMSGQKMGSDMNMNMNMRHVRRSY
jgi:hypothetical protein